MGKCYPMTELSEVLIQSKEYVEEPGPKLYPKLSVKLYGKGVVLDTPADGSQLKMKRHQIAKTGQVILSEIWGKKGAIGFVPPQGNGALCTSHFFLFDVNSYKIDHRYLQAIFTANYLEDQLGVEARGTTGYAAVRPKNLLSAKIPLPPLEEQQRIVSRIEELAAKIEEARELREATNVEVSKLLESSSSSLLKRLGGNNWYPLRRFVAVQSGSTPSKSNPFYWNGTIPWISPKDMKARAISTSIDHISEAAVQEGSARLLNPGCVLIVVRGMILAHTVPTAILCTAAAINQDIKALLPNEEILPEYLCAALWGLNRELLALVEKSTHDTRRLETDKLLSLSIPLLSIEEQQTFVAYLDSLQAKVNGLKNLQAETSTELDALLPSILDKAFKGEL
jgi:type I restriction enzyme, S subunit